MSLSKIFYVYGCYGTMTVEVGTGNVLDYEWHNLVEKKYADIARIDVQTFEMTFGLQIKPEDRICIMDFNFWSHDGQYFVLDSPKAHDEENDWPQPVIVLHEPNELLATSEGTK